MIAFSENDRGQGGFTLVEVLVATALGLLLIMTVVQAYVANNRASRFNESFGIMQENGRFALSFLRKAIEMGGYDDRDTPSFIPHALGHPVEGTDGPESLTVYYEGGLGIRDCTGAIVAVGAGVSDTFSLSGDGLVCNGATEAVVSGIEDFQVLYGLDDSAPAGVPNHYVPGSDVGDWSKVVAVQIGLLMRTDLEVTDSPDGATYQVLDQTFGPVGDRRIRKLFTTTIALRN